MQVCATNISATYIFTLSLRVTEGSVAISYNKVEIAASLRSSQWA